MLLLFFITFYGPFLPNEITDQSLHARGLFYFDFLRPKHGPTFMWSVFCLRSSLKQTLKIGACAMTLKCDSMCLKCLVLDVPKSFSLRYIRPVHNNSAFSMLVFHFLKLCWLLLHRNTLQYQKVCSNRIMFFILSSTTCGIMDANWWFRYLGEFSTKEQSKNFKAAPDMSNCLGWPLSNFLPKLALLE